MDLFEMVYNYIEFGNGRVRRERYVGLAEKTHDAYVAYGHVVHEKSKRKISFGMLPHVASLLAGTVGEMSGLPMNQYTFSAMQPLLDEGVAGGKMLNDVLVFDVIDLDDVMLEMGKEMVIERQSQDGYYMSDVGLGQGIFAP